MKLRHKKTGRECTSGRYNIHSLSEIIVHFEDGDADSDYQREYDVWLESKQEWKDLRQAFTDKDVIPNNENTSFCESRTDKERELGYSE